MAGHVSSKHAYWESEILQDHPSRDTLLGWIRGVRLTEVIDRSRKSTYQGHAYNGADLTPIVKLSNHVPQEFDAWVDEEVAALVNKGCIARWSEVVDVSTHPKPNVTLPVGVEPTKLRFICDARYLNLMCKHSEFKIDGVGKVAVFMARSTPNFHGPQVRVSQRASTPRFMDVFRYILEGSVLCMDRPVFRMV